MQGVDNRTGGRMRPCRKRTVWPSCALALAILMVPLSAVGQDGILDLLGDDDADGIPNHADPDWNNPLPPKKESIPWWGWAHLLPLTDVADESTCLDCECHCAREDDEIPINYHLNTDVLLQCGIKIGECAEIENSVPADNCMGYTQKDWDHCVATVGQQAPGFANCLKEREKPGKFWCWSSVLVDPTPPLSDGAQVMTSTKGERIGLFGCGGTCKFCHKDESGTP